LQKQTVLHENVPRLRECRAMVPWLEPGPHTHIKQIVLSLQSLLDSSSTSHTGNNMQYTV